MKRHIAISALSALLFIFLLSGCDGGGKELSRYPSVKIPEYNSEDYYRLLSDKNNEVVYNAVCNLIDEASTMGSTLSDKKTDKNFAQFTLASDTYKKITALLQSRDDRIVSASLRFLQLFSKQYNKKEELVESVLNIKNKNQGVRYEQLATLSAVVSKNSRVPETFLEKSLKDRSWLVSRAAYGLVNRLGNNKTRSMLIAKYRSMDSECEKLLILTAMVNDFSSDVFKFLSKEALESKNDKIKSAILPIFQNARNTSEALNWIDENYEKLSEKDIEKINNYSSISDDFACALYSICIKKGWVPDGPFLDTLYVGLNMAPAANGGAKPTDVSEDDIRRANNLRTLEKNILETKAAKDKWLSFKDQKDALAKSIGVEMKAEYDAMVEQFKEKAGNILAKHNVDPGKEKDFLDILPSVFLNDESFDNAVNVFKIMPQPEK